MKFEETKPRHFNSQRIPSMIRTTVSEQLTQLIYKVLGIALISSLQLLVYLFVDTFFKCKI